MLDGVFAGEVGRIHLTKEHAMVEVITNGATHTCRWKPDEWIEIGGDH